MKNNSVKKKNTLILKKVLESIIHIVVYAIILLFISSLFNTLDINNNYFGIYYLFVASIIYILNKTIKPILFRLTIPITGITLGLFYPCINVLILKITDFILGNSFQTYGIISLFFTSILISLINKLIEDLLLKKLERVI